jgi:hypothetical protein
MTDYLTPVPVGQPIHFDWIVTVAPYEVEFKWDMPHAKPKVTEQVCTWINGMMTGSPVINQITTLHYSLDLTPTSTPGPVRWRVQGLDNIGNSLWVDEGVISIGSSPLRN